VLAPDLVVVPNRNINRSSVIASVLHPIHILQQPVFWFHACALGEVNFDRIKSDSGGDGDYIHQAFPEAYQTRFHSS
jgi:hypothetical protein